jgi:hypothetical protein
LRNTSSVDCPDSGFIVLLLPNPVSEPEPTLEWRKPLRVGRGR